MSKPSDQSSPLGIILFAFLAFHFVAVLGVFLANGTSLIFDIIAAEPMMSGFTSAILSIVALICGYALFRKKQLTVSAVVGFGIVCTLAANFALAAHIGSVDSVVSPLAISGDLAQQPVGVAMQTVGPLTPLVIAMMLCLPAIRMVNPDVFENRATEAVKK